MIKGHNYTGSTVLGTVSLVKYQRGKGCSHIFLGMPTLFRFNVPFGHNDIKSPPCNRKTRCKSRGFELRKSRGTRGWSEVPLSDE